MSSASSVNDALTDYLAGRTSAEKVVTVVAAEYYRDARSGVRDAMRPLIEIIERAQPGGVELSARVNKPGFDVRLTERPFPRRYEGELRQGVQAFLVAGLGADSPHPPSRISHPGFFSRIVAAVRRLFSA